MNRERCPSLSFCVLVALALPLGAHAQARRLGNEFQVTTYTVSGQKGPSVAADADGDFVVAWQSNTQDGSYLGVFARRFSSTGAPLGSEFQVSTYTISAQKLPRVAAEADGDFVVVWGSLGQDGIYYGVFARRFSSTGTPLATEFQVNTVTADTQRYPSVAADADGDFVVVWMSNAQDGESYGVFARRFSSAGAPLASEFQVNTYTPSYQELPSVAADADGDFVVVWQSNGQDGSSDGIFARRFSSAGAPLATEFQVSSYTSNAQYEVSVAADAAGNFVVAWDSYDQDGSDTGIFARSFSSAGAPLATEFQVNVYTMSGQIYPRVAANADGDFVVAWGDRDGSLFGVFARRLSTTGAFLTNEFQVNTYTPGQQRYPAVAVGAGGDFVVAWESYSQDGFLAGVFAQRFAGLVTLDIDGNGSLSALTDGLLVLRSLFGFTGATLTIGVVGGGCTRCDATTIEPYVAGLGLTLDIDGNGSVGALTDGLLALRYLFGFDAATLTIGAVGGGCSRCDAVAIEAYLAGLTS